MQSLTVCTMHLVYSGLCSAPWTLTVSVKTALCISAGVESQCGLMETLFFKGFVSALPVIYSNGCRL